MGQIINWTTFSLLSLIFLCTPYLRGLFFDADMYLIEVILLGLFLINSLWLFVKQPEKTRAIYLVIFLLPLTHFLSLTSAEAFKGALDNLFRWLSYSAMFVLLIWNRSIINTKLIDKLLPIVFQLTGIWVSFFAMLGLLGMVDFKDIMLGERLTGTFQYANTFAALICAFWLFSLVYLTKRDLSKWDSLLFSLPLVAYGASLFYSYSRGALVVFPIAWLIGMLLLKGKQQVLFILNSIISIISSFFVFRQLVANQEGTHQGQGLILILVTTLVVVALVAIVRRILNKYNTLSSWGEKRYSRYYVPAAIIIIGALLLFDLKFQGAVYHTLPTSFQERITDINTQTSSVLGRTNVYEDAFEISKDAPFFGIGGEGWKVAYPAHQEVPYLNNEIHNGYLEILLSTGWIGLLAFLLVIGVLVEQVVIRMRQEEEQTLPKAVLVALAMILLHAAIDFDLSYGTVWFVVVWLFAMAVPIYPQTSAVSSNFTGIRTLIVAISIFVLIGGVYATRFYLAERTLTGLEGQITIDKAQPALEKAVSYNPYNTDYQTNLANVYATRYRQDAKDEWKQKAINQIEEAIKQEPNRSTVLMNAGNTYVTLNEWEKGFAILDEALTLDPFNVQIVDNNIRASAGVAAQLAGAKQKDQAISLANKALDLYADYIIRYEPFKSQDIPDKRPLELSNSTYFFVGQSYVMLGRYQQGIGVLKTVNDSQLNINAQALLVVAYEATGKGQEAKAITQKLIPQYPEFAQKVVAYRGIVIQ